MAVTWIVAANAGHARIFTQEKAGAPLAEVEGLKHAATRLRTSDTETDELGQQLGTKAPGGTSSMPGSGYEPHQTPAEHQSELFAREVAATLTKGQQGGRYTQLVLMASPEFLGLLRKLISPQVHGAVRLEIAKDYTQLDPKALRDRLAEHEAKA